MQKCIACTREAHYKNIYTGVHLCASCRKNASYYRLKNPYKNCEICKKQKAYFVMFGKRVCKHCVRKLKSDIYAFYDFCNYTIPLIKGSFTFKSVFNRFKEDYSPEIESIPPINLIIKILPIKKFEGSKVRRWIYLNNSIK